MSPRLIREARATLETPWKGANDLAPVSASCAACGSAFSWLVPRWVWNRAAADMRLNVAAARERGNEDHSVCVGECPACHCEAVSLRVERLLERQ